MLSGTRLDPDIHIDIIRPVEQLLRKRPQLTCTGRGWLLETVKNSLRNSAHLARRAFAGPQYRLKELNSPLDYFRRRFIGCVFGQECEHLLKFHCFLPTLATGL